MTVVNLINLNNVELTRFLFAILLLLFFADSLAYIFEMLKLPRVIGEISGGILLGPSFLGFFQPQIYQFIFQAFEFEGKLLACIYWLGLVLLMFIAGFEAQRSFNSIDKKIIGVLLGATIIPFLAGWFAPLYYDFSPFMGIKNNAMALKIVISIAIAVTSIPVISKIFIDLKIMDTRFAKIVLATATIHDVILWVALSVATSMINSHNTTSTEILVTVVITFTFFTIMLLITPRIIRIISDNKLNLVAKSSFDGYSLFLCLIFSTLASFLNVNIIFGAFLAGIIFSSLKNKQLESAKTQIKNFSIAFFIPIYFSIVGLKIDFIHHLDISLWFMFLFFSSFFQMGGTFLASRLLKLDKLSSFNFAVAMNTRGGPGIVLATIAYDLGIISETFFVILVSIAIITSLFAGWWFKYLLSKGYHLLK